MDAVGRLLTRIDRNKSSRRQIFRTTSIPKDIFLHIIEFIDHPKDLLSFALTARASHAAIVPRHIDYRRISIPCTKSSEGVWKHLLDIPYACSYIRCLDILLSHDMTEVPRLWRIESESDSGTPPLFFRRDENDISDTFIQALSKMVNLKVLKFQTSGRNDEGFCLISEAIGKAGCDLEELEVLFDSPHTAIEQRFKKDKVSKDLKTCSLFYDYPPLLRKYTIKSGNQYDGGVFLQMLLNTPNLTYMNVASGLSSAFFSGYWPNLQHLKFHNYMNPTMGKDYLSGLRTFLRRHPKLVTLSTNNILRPGWVTESDDFLPNLKSFYINVELHLHTITTNIAARLTHLEMNNDLYWYLTKGIVLSNPETCVYWITHLESIQNLVVMAPNVQKLCITFEPVLCGFDSELDAVFEQLIPDHEVMEHVSQFAGFKNLHVLIGPFDDTLVDSHLLFKVLYNFPRLLYTRVRLEKGDLEIFRLERDDIVKVMRYEYEVCPDECNFFSWDGVYEK